jgi:hypothetical protein
MCHPQTACRLWSDGEEMGGEVRGGGIISSA